MKQQQDQEEVTAAVAAAIAYLTPHVKRGVFEGEVKILGVIAKAFLKTDPDGYQYLIEQAIAGDVMIDAALREVISEKVLAHETLPRNLEQYLINYILPIGRNTKRVNKGGRPAGDFLIRNAVICRAVTATMSHGFHSERNDIPSRNDIPRVESACSIVVLALKELGVVLTEKSVARIWRTGIQDQLQRFSPAAGEELQ
jgi:hypothetical protein